MLRMEEFVTKTLLLLTQEREAEIEESQVIVSQHLQYPDRLQSKGICLTKLYVRVCMTDALKFVVQILVLINSLV